MMDNINIERVDSTTNKLTVTCDGDIRVKLTNEAEEELGEKLVAIGVEVAARKYPLTLRGKLRNDAIGYGKITMKPDNNRRLDRFTYNF